MKNKTKAWINLVLLLLTLVVNFLGGTGRINNASQEEVSNMYHTLITPAGFTFSIWGIIYGLLFISLIVMLIKEKDSYFKAAIDRITPLLWIAFVTNMIWIVTFSYLKIGLSTIFIFIYLLSLIILVQRLRHLNDRKYWLLPLTFGLNAGWLFIATVVNIAAYLVQIEWDGFGIAEDTWALIIMIVALLLATFVQFQIKNAVFSLPIAWAFFGIYQELQITGAYPTLEIMALVNLGIFILLALYSFIHNRYSIYPLRQGFRAYNHF
ncbi:MAG TPA: tryptophan-rich sensory protein [Candidatus Atopostipes pullistercoris]|uniref:Tryptophan-rich sensory protein n=1 Tax=Candidatus Atopostipes pullistercoris TaxID=2838467 RepID=A0A9D2JWS2_9LACT|nr:tryptophan-rich sensory protein [Candidatus Atopostipes pullistercoris]